MEHYRHDDPGMRKTEHKTLKRENVNKQNKSGQKEQKATEEESQANIAHKNELREGTCYFCENSGYIQS